MLVRSRDIRIVVAMFSINNNNVSKVSDEIRVILDRLNAIDDLKLIDSKLSFDILANNERKELVEHGESLDRYNLLARW